MSSPEQRIIKSRFPPVAVLGIAVLLALLLYGAWHFLGNRNGEDTGTTPRPAPREEEWSGEEAFGPDWDKPPAAPVEERDGAESACGRAAAEVAALFSRLDGRGYLAKRGIAKESRVYFPSLARRLLAAPPLVNGETENLYTIVANTTHFYRVLGKGDLFLLREILNQEEESLEKDLALLHRWSELAPECGETGLLLDLPLAGLYEYAGFFLNTLGGQSYLMRRDPRVRLLAGYYSLLILDRANAASLNRHGLDIRPPLEKVLREMRSTSGLAGREAYLRQLARLQAAYAAQYGEPTPARPRASRGESSP